MENDRIDIGAQVTDEWLESIGVGKLDPNGADDIEDFDNGVHDLQSSSFAEAICRETDSVARTAMFEMSYYYHCGRFSNENLNKVMTDLYGTLSLTNLFWKFLEDEDRKEKFLKVIKKMSKKGAKKLVTKMMENIIVSEIVKASAGKGSRQAILIIQKSALSMFAKGTLKGLASLRVNIAGAIGEVASDLIATRILGVEDQTALLAIRSTGGILASVAVGACIGGPAGAAGGLVVGGIGVAIGEGINILGRAFESNVGTHCYIVRNSGLGYVTAGSYNQTDGIRLVTYNTRNLDGITTHLTAGQAEEESFQVRFWDESGTLVSTRLILLEKVYAGDYLFVDVSGGYFTFVHCSGPNSPTPSKNTRDRIEK